ncbi:MAG: xanthine dehydrogenase family protein [Spirochaetales bacterium]|nr:xanthine dehydrogenase family protein [Spirochaetales bacterium]
MSEDKFRNRMAGKVRFPEDISSKKMVYALQLKARKAPGLLEGIILPRLPGHISFFQASDIPGKNILPYPDDDVPLLAEKEILYTGQAVGLLTGPDLDELFSIRKQIEIKISPIPGFPPSRMRDRQASPVEKMIRKGSTLRGLEKADSVVEGSFTLTVPEMPVYPEHDVYCSKEGGTYRLHLHSQWPSLLRKLCAQAAGISRKQVEIHFNPAGRTGDAHIWQSIPHAALCVCATSILRQPVKLIAEAEERHKKEIYYSYRAGVDAGGRLTAVDARIYLNTGAYCCFSSEVAARLCLGAAGLYQCRHMDIQVKSFKSNTPPWLPLSTWGLAQGAFGIEMLVNHIAVESGQDPAEWRCRNLSSKGNLNTTMRKLRETPPLADMISSLAKVSDYTRKHAVSRQIRTNRTALPVSPSSYTGIGMAAGRQGYEFLSRDKLLSAASVSATLQKEGHLDVHLGTVPASPGMLAIWKKNISAALSLEEDQIHLFQDRPDEHSFNGPSCLSRNTIVFTRLIDQCCSIIQKKRFREGLPITETRSYRRRTANEWNEDEMTGNPFSNPSWGCAVVEVSLYTATKEISIPRIWLTVHCGTLLDPPAARSFVESEVRLALVQCMEKQAIKPSLFPELHLEFLEDKRKTVQPGGLEGLALGTIPPAFIQAVSQASGLTVTGLPVNSASLLAGGL